MERPIFVGDAWFVAPTAVRATILEGGIVPHPEFDGDALHFYDDLEAAEDEARDAAEGFTRSPDGRADLWQVSLDGLEVTMIPATGDAENVKYVGSVEPARVTLHSTF